MSDAPVKFVGADEAAADLRRWADQLGHDVDRKVEPLAQRVADAVAGRVPVLSGALASSVDVAVDDEGVGVHMGDGVPYAGWIEFGGTRGRPYVPDGRYLYPTALEFTDEFTNTASDAADDSAKRFSWSTPST